MSQSQWVTAQETLSTPKQTPINPPTTPPSKHTHRRKPAAVTIDWSNRWLSTQPPAPPAYPTTTLFSPLPALSPHPLAQLSLRTHWMGVGGGLCGQRSDAKLPPNRVGQLPPPLPLLPPPH